MLASEVRRQFRNAFRQLLLQGVACISMPVVSTLMGLVVFAGEPSQVLFQRITRSFHNSMHRCLESRLASLPLHVMIVRKTHQLLLEPPLRGTQQGFKMLCGAFCLPLSFARKSCCLLGKLEIKLRHHRLKVALGSGELRVVFLASDGHLLHNVRFRACEQRLQLCRVLLLFRLPLSGMLDDLLGKTLFAFSGTFASDRVFFVQFAMSLQDLLQLIPELRLQEFNAARQHSSDFPVLGIMRGKHLSELLLQLLRGLLQGFRACLVTVRMLFVVLAAKPGNILPHHRELRFKNSCHSRRQLLVLRIVSAAHIAQIIPHPQIQAFQRLRQQRVAPLQFGVVLLGELSDGLCQPGVHDFKPLLDSQGGHLVLLIEVGCDFGQIVAKFLLERLEAARALCDSAPVLGIDSLEESSEVFSEHAVNVLKILPCTYLMVSVSGIELLGNPGQLIGKKLLFPRMPVVQRRMLVVLLSLCLRNRLQSLV
mmetsp:Transcript_49842/g.132312  ORF Transcript_49842/g.132312 Transcript_49842/m.132312 type:complete len:480 (+) Transcript_49842:1624-3063(+)